MSMHDPQLVNPEAIADVDGLASSSAERAILQMYRLIYGNWQTCVTYVFAELGLADHLHEGPRSVRALAGATEVDEGALARLLRCAETLNFVEQRGGKYALTQFGGLLRSDHPLSQRAAARLNGAPYRYEPWGRLLDIVRAGSSHGFSPTVEDGTLPYLADKPELLEVFHKAMTDLSTGQDAALAAAWDFSGFRHVVDVGGGRGTFLDAVLQAAPHLSGTLLDLAPPERDDQPAWSFVASDVLMSVPALGDVYTMKNVIHNGPEDRAVALLTNVRRALEVEEASETPVSDRRLLILEHLVTDDRDSSVAKWLDLNFMVLVDGAERTYDEYDALAAKAGLRLLGATKTAVGRHVLELGVPG